MGKMKCTNCDGSIRHTSVFNARPWTWKAIKAMKKAAKNKAAAGASKKSNPSKKHKKAKKPVQFLCGMSINPELKSEPPFDHSISEKVLHVQKKTRKPKRKSKRFKQSKTSALPIPDPPTLCRSSTPLASEILNENMYNSNDAIDLQEIPIEEVSCNEISTLPSVIIGNRHLKVVGMLRLIAIESTLPDHSLDTRLVDYIEDQLWQLTNEPNVPKFAGAMFINGVLFIRGTDINSTEWLRHAIDCIPPIDGIRFLTSYDDLVCRLVKGYAFIPGKYRPITEVLRRIGNQNPGLTPEIWVVRSWTQTNGGSNLVVEIDENNAKVLYQRYNMVLSLSIWRVFINFE